MKPSDLNETNKDVTLYFSRDLSDDELGVFFGGGGVMQNSSILQALLQFHSLNLNT